MAWIRNRKDPFLPSARYLRDLRAIYAPPARPTRYLRASCATYALPTRYRRCLRATYVLPTLPTRYLRYLRATYAPCALPTRPPDNRSRVVTVALAVYYVGAPDPEGPGEVSRRGGHRLLAGGTVPPRDSGAFTAFRALLRTSRGRRSGTLRGGGAPSRACGLPPERAGTGCACGASPKGGGRRYLTSASFRGPVRARGADDAACRRRWL